MDKSLELLSFLLVIFCLRTSCGNLTSPRLNESQTNKSNLFIIGNEFNYRNFNRNENGKIVCNAYGDPIPSIVWSRQNRKNIPRSNINERKGDGQESLVSTLHFNKVQSTDGGTYTCTANNSHGSAKTSFVVSVKPDITRGSSNFRNFTPRENDKIICRAFGYPIPLIEWSRQDGQIIPRSSINQREEDDQKLRVSTLYLNEVQASDGGAYICSARSPSGSDTRVFHVSVTPEVSLNVSSDVVFMKGERSSINCTATGYPTPEVDWFKGNTPFNVQTSSSTYANTAILTFDQIEYSNGGSYSCRSRNNTQKNIEISVESPPVPVPTTNIVGILNDDSVTFRCIFEGNPIPQIQWRFSNGRFLPRTEEYRIFTPTITALNPHQYSKRLTVNRARCNGLLQNRFKCFASNKHSASEVKSEQFSVNFSSSRIVSRRVEKAITLQNFCNGTALQINWSPPQTSMGVSYEIKVDETIRQKVSATKTSATIRNLTPRTRYNVKIKAVLSNCDYQRLFYNKPLRTGRGQLSRPRIVSCPCNNNRRHCNVIWDLDGGSTMPDVEIGSFIVQLSEFIRSDDIRSDGKTRTTPRYTVSNKVTNYVFESNPNSKYEVFVEATPEKPCHNLISSKRSRTYSCTTSVAAPDSIPLSSTPPSYEGEKISLTLESVSQRNGPISCIIVVLQRLQNGTSSRKIEDPTQLTRDNLENQDTNIAYVTSSFSNSITFELGNNQKTCCDLTNLNPQTNCEKQENAEKNIQTTTNTIVATNRPLKENAYYSYYVITSTPSDGGALYASSERSLPFYSNETISSISLSPSGAAAVASVVASVLVISVCVLLFVFYRRRKQENKASSKKQEGVEMKTLQDSSMAPQRMNKTRSNPRINVSGRNSDPIYVNVSSSRPQSGPFTQFLISSNQILPVYKAKRKDDDRIFSQEFENTLLGFVKALKMDVSISQKIENAEKNRYKNILPSNEHRVVLKRIRGIPFSDYINASYIDGYNHPSKFIATQGPKDNTIADFWRMILQVRCSVIVMVTQVKEGRKNKCSKYWPEEGEKAQHGNIVVEGIRKICCGEFQTTTILIRNLSNGTTMETAHLQYLNWPDHGVPSTTSGIVRLHKSATFCHVDQTTPMVVHCSAGVGRTGTFIAFDILLHQSKEENRINVLETVYKLRSRRTQMVQSLDQYIYLHKLMTEMENLEITEAKISHFISYKDALFDQSNGLNWIKEQLELLTIVPPLFTSTRVALKQANRNKNLDNKVLPYDDNLAFISMTYNEIDCPYINASYVRAYLPHSYFILAQNPFPENVHLFWRCIMDHQIKYLVMIEDNSSSCENYWGSLGSLETFLDVAVGTINEVDYSTHLERNLDIYKRNEPRPYKVKQIVIKGWTNTSTPSPSSVLQVVNILQQASSEAVLVKEKRNAALIHCRDGATLSGTLCAIYNLIERVKNEDLIDVFREVKDVRDLRMGAVGNEEQLKFCYEVVTAYIESFDLYANARYS